MGDRRGSTERLAVDNPGSGLPVDTNRASEVRRTHRWSGHTANWGFTHDVLCVKPQFDLITWETCERVGRTSVLGGEVVLAAGQGRVVGGLVVGVVVRLFEFGDGRLLVTGLEPGV